MEPSSPSAPPVQVPPAALTESPPEKLAQARELVQGLLMHMGVEAPVSVTDQRDGIHISFDPGGSEVFGQGRRHELIESMGYLVNKAINREEQGRRWVFLDVGGAATPNASAPAEPVAVDPDLRALAADLANQVQSIGVFWAGPIPTRIRRGLEAALQEMPGLRARAEGEGAFRRIVIEVA